MSNLFDFFLPPAKSTLAPYTDSLFNFVMLASTILMVGITIAMIYFVLRYRRKSESDVTPVITHNSKLEITWSVIPLILVLIVFGWGFKGYLFYSNAPKDAYEVHVTGQKWLWQFNYENGSKSTGELHVPANRPVKLVMSSNDVIHSFYVPAFRIKRDVVPGQYTTVWFETDEEGESVIFCTEYCGTGHSDMMGKVIAHSESDFQDWLASSAQPATDLSPAEHGAQLVKQNACLTCHSLDGTRKTGPSFKGLWGREEQMSDGSTVKADENYIRESILEPKAKVVQGYPAVMPTFQGSLNDSEINAIIEYLKQQK
jgi:cytochrome c oxidase subunit 2